MQSVILMLVNTLRTWLRLPFLILLRCAFYYPKVAAAYLAYWRGKRDGVVKTIDGSCKFENGVFAIFVIWQRGELPWYVLSALRALKDAEVNVIIVANRPPAPEAQAVLQTMSATIMVRDNSGYDFGGYRDATLYAAKRFTVQRMLYLNDSVYFFERGLEDMVRKLATTPADACTAFENWEQRYHLQSFALSVSGKVFAGAPFQRFWKRYLPVSARRWAINVGELGLTRDAIRPSCDSIEVIYSPNDLLPHIQALSGADLQAINRYLPVTQRIHNGDFRMRTRVLIDTILMNRVPSRSQIHTAGFLAHRFLNCPIIKRDLVYRHQFTVYDVEYCLTEAGSTEHLDAILTDMRLKGLGHQLPLIKRLQFLDGII